MLHCRILVDLSAVFYNIMPWYDEFYEIGQMIRKMRMFSVLKYNIFVKLSGPQPRIEESCILRLNT